MCPLALAGQSLLRIVGLIRRVSSRRECQGLGFRARPTSFELSSGISCGRICTAAPRFFVFDLLCRPIHELLYRVADLLAPVFRKVEELHVQRAQAARTREEALGLLV